MARYLDGVDMGEGIQNVGSCAQVPTFCMLDLPTGTRPSRDVQSKIVTDVDILPRRHGLPNVATIAFRRTKS